MALDFHPDDDTDSSPLEPTTLLLVDDHPPNLVALEALLAPLGQHLHLAGSGEEALRFLLSTPDCAAILLDVQMPNLDGLQTARLIRQRRATRAIPILFLTAQHRDAQALCRGYAEGAVDYLVKPLEPDILRAKVRVFVELHHQRARVLRQEQALRESTRREEALRAGERLYRHLLSSESMGLMLTEPDGRVRDANDTFLRLVGRSREELEQGALDWRVLTPPEHHAASEHALAGLEARGSTPQFEKEYLHRDGARVPVLVGSVAVPEEGRFLTYVVDIRRHKQAERELRLLSEVSVALSRSLDLDAVLAEVTRLLVPEVADGCGVDLMTPEGLLRGVAAAHLDPAREAQWWRSRKAPLPMTGPGLVEAVARTGRPVWEPEVTDAHRRTWARSEETRQLLHDADMRSTVVVPLVARERTLGVLTLMLGPGTRRFTAGDVRLAEELARRMALSVDNAQLFQEAQEAIRARDDFLSVASHELKTPLTPLHLKLQMLQREARAGGAIPAERVAATAAAADAQVRKLASLTSELLDVARIRAGRLQLSLEEVDLVALAREVVARHQPQAAQAGCTVEVDGPPSLTGTWDRMRLDQVVTNLLTNALKYGAGRPVSVRVEAVDGRARLSVQDAGIGVALEDQARIFGRFERAVSERHYGGLGLGLFIARQIAEALGGSLQVSSVPGQGATFTVDLPPRAVISSVPAL